MSKFVVLSDLHIGDQTDADDFYTHKSEKPFLEFLDWVIESKDISEVIFAGDLFELWQSKIEVIFQYYPKIWRKLYQVKEKEIKLIYVPGNHDSLPFTRFSIEKIPFGVGPIEVTVQSMIDKKKGLAFSYYQPEAAPNLWIEHGHRFDKACRNATPLAGNTNGLFGNMLAKLATKFGAFGEKAIHDDFDEFFLNMKTSAEEAADSVKDKITSKFYEIAASLQLYIPPSSDDYIGNLSEYEEGASTISKNLKPNSKNFVVFGHTHKAKLSEIDEGKTVYANDGSWVQDRKTFVIFDSKTNEISINEWNRKVVQIESIT